MSSSMDIKYFFLQKGLKIAQICKNLKIAETLSPEFSLKQNFKLANYSGFTVDELHKIWVRRERERKKEKREKKRRERKRVEEQKWDEKDTFVMNKIFKSLN